MSIGPEAKVENALVRAVKRHGGMTRKMNGAGYRAWPDRLVLLPAVEQFYVECKAPGKYATDQQRALHNKLRQQGAIVFVVDSVDMAEGIVLTMATRQTKIVY